MLLRGDGAAAPAAAGAGGDAALRGQRSHLRPRLMPEIRGSLPEVGISSTTLVATTSCSSLGLYVYCLEEPEAKCPVYACKLAGCRD